MRKLYLLVFIVIIAFIAFPTVSLAQTRKLDSLYHLLKTHPEEDSLRAKLLYGICYYESKINPQKSKVLASEGLRISTDIKFRKGIGFAHKYLAGYYRKQGDYAQAAEHAFEMLAAFEGTSNAKGLGQAYQLLGIVNQDSQNPEKAKVYYGKATEIFEKAGLKLDLSFAYNSIGALNIDMKRYEEALIYQFKAVELRKALNYEDDVFMYANIATTYKLMGNYSMALEFFQKELPRMASTSFKDGAAIAYIELGDLYTLLGEYRRAEDCLMKSVTLAKTIQHKKILSDAYDKFTHLEKVRKNYATALTYRELSEQYRDSIFTDEKAKQMAELEIRYQSEKKDQAIQSLEQQRQIQRLKQWYLVGGLLILVIIFVVVYFLQGTHNSRIKALLDIQKALNTKLQESDEMKSKFFANISHEFRTPLTLIMAPIDDKLRAPQLSPADKRSFQVIKRNAVRLLILINQLLDLSKLEAKKMELRIQPGDMRNFISILAASFDSLTEHNGIRFLKNIHINSVQSWYDADKLEKIINNLLSNAVKFTPAGGIVILSVNQINATDMQITVEDTGKGIPVEEQEHVFSPFYQSRFHEDEAQPGTGLGLSLVKELVKLYGGTILLTSKVNVGTTISVILPIANEKFSASVISQQSVAEETEESYLKLTATTDNDSYEAHDRALELDHRDSILVVEDNLDLRAYIASVLLDEFTVFTAKDGEEGFALATEQIPHLIISDVMMPNLNGIGLTEKIKSDERTSHIPVVLLTAKADEESKIEGLLTGADDYLSKPFSVSELKIRIANLIEQRKKLAIKYRAELAVPVSSPPLVHELSLDEKFLAKVRNIVEENIGNNSFGVELLASEVHLSRAQLFRKLKAIANLSPNEFINEIRLQKAAEMIRARADGLTQISYSVGYSEQSYFAKRFRKKFGMTPSEYQAKHAIEK